MRICNHIAAAIVALLANTVTVTAQDSQEYYTGTFTCAQTVLNTDWVANRNLGGSSSVTVYYQQRGATQVQWLKLTEQETSNNRVLVDDRGNVRLLLSENDAAINASWKEGSPYKSCEPFNVTKTDSVKSRLDKLLSLLNTALPTAEDAKKATEALDSTPIVFALPELDQQPYMQRLSTAVPEFWKRYRSSVADGANIPLDTEDARKNYVIRIHHILDDTLPALMKNRRDATARKDTALALQMASDRLADAGYPLAAAYDVSNSKVMCQRLSLMNKSFYQLDDLELAVGVSFDYWTRELAENVLRGSKTCENAEHYVRSLTEGWPRIQEKQTRIAAFKAERDRLLALPLTFATLVETRNLQPDRKQINLKHSEQDFVARFFGKNLESRRNELEAASLNEIALVAASNGIDQSENVKKLSENCNQLRRLESSQAQDTITAACTTALASAAKKQAEEGVARINAAFDTAEPLAPAADQARQLCKDLSDGFVLRDAVPALRSACQSGDRKLKEKEEAQRCVIAVEKSGADADLLDATIVVKGSGSDNRTTIKELVCEASRNDFQIIFRSEGALMWSKQVMTLHSMPGSEEAFSVELASAEGEADWKVSSWIGDQQTGSNDTPLDQITACLVGTSSCKD
ncbi:hypothetical protein RMR16_020205 [Agrobacterium sp. rho-13.3]|uniref:hypothetical protein n=1 Tax=Agrobacterium sp. rho-13.3 TaxID=3072980 RepID=UPI003D79865E